MSNPIKGEVLVQVEAGEFTLAFTLGACAAIEGRFEGRTLQNILEDLDGDEPRITTLLIVVWAGLKKYHKLTLDEVGDLVGMEELPIWGEAMTKAFALSSPKAEGEENPREPAAS